MKNEFGLKTVVYGSSIYQRLMSLDRKDADFDEVVGLVRFFYARVQKFDSIGDFELAHTNRERIKNLEAKFEI